MDAQLFLTVLLWLIIGGATAYYAKQRGRDPLLWFMIGMLLGLLGLLLLFLLPNVNPEAVAKEKESEGPAAPPQKTPPELPHDYFIKEWYYYDSEHNRQGPVRYEALKSLWQNGSLKEDSFVWSDGMEEWKKIAQVPTLYTHLVTQEGT